MKQGRFSEIGMSRPRKQTRRAVFLDRMTAVVPWERFEQLIYPHYPVAGRGRRPYPLRSMLKIHFMQQWFGLSDPAMEEALWETPLLRQFGGISLDFEGVPDETTILKFRHLLEKHELSKGCCQTNAHKSPFRAFRSLNMAAQAMRPRHSAMVAERSIL